MGNPKDPSVNQYLPECRHEFPEEVLVCLHEENADYAGRLIA